MQDDASTIIVYCLTCLTFPVSYSFIFPCWGCIHCGGCTYGGCEIWAVSWLSQLPDGHGGRWLCGKSSRYTPAIQLFEARWLLYIMVIYDMLICYDYCYPLCNYPLRSGNMCCPKQFSQTPFKPCPTSTHSRIYALLHIYTHRQIFGKDSYDGSCPLAD